MDVNTGFTVDPNNMYRYISSFFTNPNVYVIIFAVILIVIFIFMGLLGSSSYTETSNFDSSSSMSSTLMSIIKLLIGIIFIVFFILFIIWIIPRHFWNIFNIFNLSTTADIHNTFSKNPVIDIDVQQNTGSSNTTTNTKPSFSSKKSQVFNIPGNYYGYEEAATLCQAYDARLAKYDEVEKSYNEGGEWCNYGWSDGQMALFPTQAETYKNLQTISGHENDCGRPGVNGGYIANPNVRFGVNCYGKKPKMTDKEKELMETTTPYPLTEKDILKDEQIKYWKQKLDNILVSPFNYKNWSKV